MKKNYIDIRWHTNDIIECIQNAYELELTEEQTIQVLEELKHNGSIGINWEIIEITFDIMNNKNQLGKVKKYKE